MQLHLSKGLPARRTHVIKKAKAEIAPEILKRPEKGSGPIGSLPNLSEVEQLKEENMAFSSSSTSPLSVALMIASDISMTNDDPFGKA